MRIGRGCERCRLRHIRCTIKPGASACNSCSRLARTCHLDPPFRFKAVRHVYQKGQGNASRFELNWDKAQTWVKVPRSLTFIHESADESTDGGSSDNQGDPQDDNHHFDSGAQSQSHDIEDAFPKVAGLPFLGPVEPHEDPIHVPHVDGTGSVFTPSMPDDRLPAFGSAGISPGAVQSIVSPLASNSTWTGATSPMSPSNLSTSGPTALSPREAFLLRSFINKIAPWADICDLQSHFTTEVPRRALQVPMVLKAVLSLAARHDAIMSGDSDWEASEYHGQCLELLITALARPEETYDDNLLITVVVLRIYEELEHTSDSKCHWVGSNRLLNTMSKSASSGGLAEAVSWQFLRQAIYASVVQYQPMQLDLANYERSAVFQRRDDASYANTIIYLCARIIQLFQGPHASVDETEWHQLSESVEHWYQARPISWQPLQYKEPSPADNRPFPELWMMSPPAVVGMQYYHASCILLSSSERQWSSVSDYEMARLKRMQERTIASHLLQVLGLSMSNETVENAYFMACHLLHRYGYCLRHPAEQNGSIVFLTHVEKAVGWRTAWMKQELNSQWGELQVLG